MGETAEFKYRAFLSYGHTDAGWARWLHRALEGYRPPKKLVIPASGDTSKNRRIAPVFRDREELSSGADLSLAVNRALAASEALVVICSPAAAKSRWVNDEILAFSKLGRPHRIFCFLVAGEPNSGDDQECLPPALRSHATVNDGQAATLVEPLAADARPQGDGRTLAKLKLIAGLLDVGFDDLRQRDLQRRHHRMLAITGSSLLVAAVTVTLAITTVLAMAKAERSRAQAEDLVSFMLGELRESLNEIGRLDVYMEVGNKAMEYFSSLADEEVNDNTLNQRAKALRQIGTARIDHGDTEAALESYHEALEISQRLAGRDPQNPEWQLGLANGHFYVGWVHWRRGELAAAQAEFEQVLPIVDQVAAQDPDNPDYLAEQSYARTNLGRVLEIQGEFEHALAIYLEIAGINQRAVQLAPSDEELQLEVGYAHNNIGKLLQAMGEIDNATQHFQQDLLIKQAISEANPNHNLIRAALARSYYFYGLNQYWRGKLEEAKELLALALKTVEDLLLVEGGSTEWMNHGAAYSLELANVEMNLGNSATARAYHDRSIELYRMLLAIDPENLSGRTGNAGAKVQSAKLALLQNDPRQALELANRAAAELQHLHETEPRNREISSKLVEARFVLGEVQSAAGDLPAARQTWRAAREQLDRDFADYRGPEMLAVHAALQERPLDQP